MLAFSFDKSRNPTYIISNPTAVASHRPTPSSFVPYRSQQLSGAIEIEIDIIPQGQPLRLSVNVIIYQISCGQGRALSLRLCEYFNIILAVKYHILSAIQRRQQATALPRRRLLRIVRNSLWLSLTHYATPPLPQKSRSARLFGCKRPHDGSLSLPTFADCGQSHFHYFLVIYLTLFGVIFLLSQK